MPNWLNRGRTRAAVVAGAAVAASFILAGTASATISSAQNNVIVGSGSSTTYGVMTALDDLFNGMPGCNLVAVPPATQALNFSCTPPASPLVAGNGENYTNDVALREPALGSSNGILQLENQGTKTTATAAISYAASSRAPKTTDNNGLNFVAFAKDGVDWFHFTEVKGVATPSAKVTDLTSTQIQDIWNGTDTNWDQVGGTNAPIDLYAAQSGSGTESTWSSFLGFSDQTYILSKGAAYYDTHIVFENEDSQMITNGDEADAIFYFSYGKWELSCKTVCGGTAVPGSTKAKPSTAAIGEVNGVAPSKTTILNGTFPVPRFLYNVYSNGSDPAIPAATAATLNFISEVGFLCKPQTTTVSGKSTPILDPNTGVSVRTEINDAIEAAGFFVLPEGPEGVVDHPANLAKTVYAPYDPNGESQYTGYCLVTTTDGNANP
jgi:phosphate transport system substrate-binding protein